MKRWISAAVVPSVLGLPMPALAADLTCTGTIDSSFMTSDGSVVIRGSWRSDYTQVCSVTTTWNGVPPDVCAGWAAKLDAAVSLSRSIQVHYYNTGALTCATLPIYSTAPGPYYVMLL